MLWATVIRLKKTKDSAWENGIAIGTEPGTHSFETIVGYDGKVVEEVWDFEVVSGAGSFTVGGAT